MISYFKGEKVNDRITCIRSLSGELMYLIEGEKEALLMDTCLGCGSLRSFVEGLTDKPLTVVISHGHLDHAMGAPEFDKVYMNHKDIPVYREMRDIQGRKGYIQGNVTPEIFAQITDADFIPSKDMEFEDLTEGKVFDLGGIHVEAYELPGHTPGTMVFYLPEEKILITGDACNTFTFMFTGTSSIEEYRENLAGIRDRMEGKVERVFLCHHMMEVKPSIMDEVIEVCDDIMAGNTDDIPFDFMGRKVYIAKAAQHGQPRADGSWGNVVYDKAHVWKKQQAEGI